MAPTKAPNKPLGDQTHKELDKTAKAADVEFSAKGLTKEEKLRELADANVPDPADSGTPEPVDGDDDVDVDGEGDQPAPSPNATETDTGENQNPPAGEQTPPSTLATTSITEPEAVGRPGVVTGGLDDEEAQAEVERRVEGKTSDASNRNADVRAAEVPADSPLTGPKPSDAGPEGYPFPPAGDVDISTVPTKKNEGERRQPIPVGTFVLLADHKDVPNRLVGHVAMVTNSPTVLCNCDFAPRTHEHQSKNQPLTVRLRDETNATLMLYPDAFQQVGVAGRHEVLPIG